MRVVFVGLGLLCPRLGDLHKISDLVLFSFFLDYQYMKKVGISNIYFKLKPFKFMGALAGCTQGLKTQKNDNED